MLRYGLMGGQRAPLPWEFFITLGVALIGVGVATAVLFPLWSTVPELGVLEVVAWGLAGAVLTSTGLLRRRRR